MSRAPLVIIALGLVGCAKANPPGSNNNNGQPDAGITIVDAPDPQPVIDAPDQPPPIDASSSATTKTLSETPNPFVSGNASACMPAGVNSDSSYYRVFPLSEFGVTGAFHVTSVTFWIDGARGGSSTSQPATVNIGTYGGSVGTPASPGSLTLSKVSALSSVAIDIPDGDSTQQTTPITGDVPAGGVLVVEVAIPDASLTGDQFFMGSTTSDTRDGYRRAPGCNGANPVKVSSINPTMKYMIAVDGSY
jgi:hypothetical protein